MRIDRVIIKAMLSTLMAIIVLCAVMFAALVFLFPSTMMGISYNVGLDDASAWFAGRAYKQQTRIYYIAYATEVAIGTGDPENIEKYGDLFIADDGFAEYCEQLDRDESVENASGTYAQYIYGQVCAAKYRLNKKDEALELAFSVNREAFPPNNAVAAVLAASVGKNDGPVIEEILSRMRRLKTEQETARTFSDDDLVYLGKLIELAEARMENLS